MKRKNDKGFTIVELVIVIAVIAILAAVLIPTFSSMVKKANLSADEVATKNMNTALAIYTAEKGAPTTAYEVRYALSENGINADTMVPVTQGYAFYWNNTDNKIELVGDGKATAKTGWILLTSTGYGEAPTTAVTDAASLKAAIAQSKTNGTPVLVKLDRDITIPGNDPSLITKLDEKRKGIFCIGSGESLIIDANGHTITGEVTDANLFRVDNGGQLTVKNAKFETKYCAFRNGDSTLRLENVTINNTGTNACVHVAGLSDTYIVNSNITNSGGFCIGTDNSIEEYRGARLSVIKSKLTSTADDYAGINVTIYSSVTIEDSEITGADHGAYLRGCNATVKNTTFKATDKDDAGEAWGQGNNGPGADLVLACGTDSGKYKPYTTNVTIVGENVTADCVIVHQPNGEGTVNVSGITVNHYCKGEYGTTCSKDSTCGNN